MSLIEEKLSSYDEYKDRVKALESKGVTKDRVVFLFRQAEGNTQLHEVLEDVRKKPVVGTLIHILITKAEFADATCPYKNDPKFKVNDLPYAAVFNAKQTLGRNWIHKKLVGKDAFQEVKVVDLFK